MIRSCKDVRNEFLNKLSLLCLFLSIRNQRIKIDSIYIVDRFLILRKIVTILRLKSSNERSYFTLFGTITISDKGNDSPIIFEFLPLYFIETFKDIKTKFSFRFVSYLDIFVSQIISVFRGRLPRNEIQNVPFRCVETSVILPQVATTWTKFIWNSYEVTSPILKLSCTNLYAEVVLFYLELELFSNLCAILRVQKLRSAIIFFNSNNPLQRTYQTGELFKKYNLYRDIMTDILFYYFVKISKKKSPFFQWNHTCKIQR